MSCVQPQDKPLSGCRVAREFPGLGKFPSPLQSKTRKFTGVEGHHLAVPSRGFQDSSTDELDSRANPRGPLTVASGLPGMMDPKMAALGFHEAGRPALRYVVQTL
ncbi:hypothetical protein NW765_000281 [Fusarium oxysporum]|nr:hypothetical protein NW765_000281 [Fusarium oxysporum]